MRIYFNKSKSIAHVKAELEKFIFDNIASSAIYKIIILYILYGGNENEFKKYMDIHKSIERAKITKEIDKYADHENASRLENIKNYILEKHIIP
jgi:hypothetical protein